MWQGWAPSFLPNQPAPRPIRERNPKVQNLMIRVEGLTKRYAQNLAVDRISFEVEKGRIVEDGTHDQLIRSAGRYAMSTGMTPLNRCQRRIAVST